MTKSWVLDLHDVDRTRTNMVGGKGANLGELSKLDGVRVPPGFCVTTEAFQQVVSEAPAIGGELDRLSDLEAENRNALAEVSAELRRILEAAAIPEEIHDAISAALSSLGSEDTYAVRSSATAEDLPGASFAGQHDTWLNVRGIEAILEHVRRCWSALFSERAVIYRIQHGFDHRKVSMAVVVQKMVSARASGIVFTADPVTSNRKVATIEAGFGLGEALVSGLASPDRYKVRDGRVIEQAIARTNAQVLTEEQILRLERLGRRIESHFGNPQDIEWCLAGDEFHIVQSRPITTLYPIPEVRGGDNHVYVSVGHQQMMTDAMRPLGLSVFQLTAARSMHAAGGRLFVDVTKQLASPASRDALLNMVGRSDPLIKDALLAILERNFVKPLPDEAAAPAFAPSGAQVEDDRAIVEELIERSRSEIENLKREIQSRAGTELFDFILEDIQRLRRWLSDPPNMGAIMAGMNASWWINEKMLAWLGETNAADTLSQSVPDNVTSEMGLALLDVADAIRPHPDVIAYLQRVKNDYFLDELFDLDGGREARDAIERFLQKYGMRCPGEIDITRARWSERPSSLIPLILSNVRNFEPGAGKRKFEQGRRDAMQKAQTLLERLRQLPNGEEKASEADRMIERLRYFAGYREYPKYAIVNRYFVYRQALMRKAAALVEAGVIRDVEDIYYLTFEELREVVHRHRVDDRLITQRKAEHDSYRKLRPPRVITSEGEIVAGAYNRNDVPAGAIAGLAVSSGIVEGRARVILDMANANLEEGDILVTAFTDPSWTPLFVSVKGLVTEVGGLMTHGAVIAREYGLPAVVGVENATTLIRDGRRIRVNGTHGYVEIVR